MQIVGVKTRIYSKHRLSKTLPFEWALVSFCMSSVIAMPLTQKAFTSVSHL